MMRRLPIGYRFFASLTIVAMGLVPAAAQTSSPAAKAPVKSWTPPKTPWGDPDLQGEWPANGNIPLQRPPALADKATLTDQELAQREQQAQKQAEADSEEFSKGTAAVPVNPPNYWQERGRAIRQTSLVVDPP